MNVVKQTTPLTRIDLKAMKYKIPYWIQSSIIKINNRLKPKTLVLFTPILCGIVCSFFESEFKSLISKGKIVTITKISTCVK